VLLDAPKGLILKKSTFYTHCI